MKKYLFAFILLLCSLMNKAQTISTVTNKLSPGAELILKGGVGFIKGGMPAPIHFSLPSGAGTLNGIIPFPTNKAGFNTGIDFNYYFGRILGASATADYFSNAYKKINATDPPFVNANVSVTQKNQTNIFTGIGPIARFQLSPKITASAAVYGGVLWHQKNDYQADYTSRFGTTTMLKFSATTPVSAAAGKASVRVSYDINSFFSISAGVEYIMPFFSAKQYQTGLMNASSSGYFVNSPSRPNVVNTNQNSFDSSYARTKGYYLQGVESTEKLHLFAFNIGLKFRFGGNHTQKEPKKKEKDCCGECPIYGVAVTARDRYTKEVLPNTDVAIKNSKGEVIKTAKTNGFGVVVFDKIVKADYTISGLFNNVALENSSVLGAEMICDEVVQKEIIYADRNFIIKGRTVICNTNTPLPGVNVALENKAQAFKKSTMTDADGNFLLQLPETGNYQLYGRKDGFFSQVEEVNANDYNREKTLFVKIEICAEKTDCGVAIKLKNILFDLDKYTIKLEAAKELDRLVQFMQDNPSIRVELGSHTDCRNTAEYNQKLSENRAKASVDYIVSKGISRERLTGVGYGESKLLNRCADGVNCSEAEHAINRRTEMKVICPDNK